MNRTITVRRRASAAALVLGPLLFLLAVAIAPLDPGDSVAEMLRTYDVNRGAIEFSGVLGVVGALLLIPAVLAVMRATAAGAPVLSLVGGALAVAGSAAVIGLIGSDTVTVRAARARDVREPLAAAMEDGSGHGIAVIFLTFLVGTVGGLLLLGIAIVRTRVAPVWAGVAVASALVLNLVGVAVGAKPMSVLALAMLVAGLGALAVRVLATSDADWAEGRVAARRPAGGPVPASA